MLGINEIQPGMRQCETYLVTHRIRDFAPRSYLPAVAEKTATAVGSMKSSKPAALEGILTLSWLYTTATRVTPDRPREANC